MTGSHDRGSDPHVGTLIDVSEARRYVLSTLRPLEARNHLLDEALGCVSAEVITAREASPRFDNSAMDGFALRAEDTASGTARLRITNSIFAGDRGDGRVEADEAVRIMTGAPLPAGADCVCMREEATVDESGEVVFIARELRPGDYVRRVGDDVTIGQTLFEPGREVGPAMLGVLASQGFTSVLVHPRPRVGVLSTGNELTHAGAALAAGTIRDSNRPALLASLRHSDFTPVDLGVVGDSAEVITQAFEHGLRTCDAIVSTGGVSVGDADFVKSVLADLCGENARSMQVAIKPGKPFAFGVAGGVPLFGLAGNPVSTLVGFELFVRPALRRLAGHADLDRLTLTAVLDCPLPRRRDGKVHLVHVIGHVHDDGRLHVEDVARQGSHLLHAVAGCNALAVVPDGDGFDVGDEVSVMVLEPNELRRS